MTTIQKLAWFYAFGFFFIVLIGHVPGTTDSNGLLFGGFSIQPIDDLLHGASGAWAAWAAWHSAKESRRYFRWFGTFYTTDACIGFFTGYAILDFVTGNWGANANYHMSHITENFLINLPHFIIGPVALWIGYRYSKHLKIKKS